MNRAVNAAEDGAGRGLVRRGPVPAPGAAAFRMLSIVSVLPAMVALIAPAVAAPPTVVPSPGYDARLSESRRALAAGSPYQRYDDRYHEPLPGYVTPRHPRRGWRHHH